MSNRIVKLNRKAKEKTNQTQRRINKNRITEVTLGAFALMAVALLLSTPANAALFGGTIEIGDTGNGNDGTGYGNVDYKYRIGKYEVSQSEWDTFQSATTHTFDSYDTFRTGIYGDDADQPAAGIDVMQASAYANWLTTGDPQQGVYDPNADYTGWDAAPVGRQSSEMQTLINNNGTVYAIPTENEFYKAAYYNLSDGTYYDYANTTNTGDGDPLEASQNSPGQGWLYDANGSADVSNLRAVDMGAVEQNETVNIMGNVREWTENVASPYNSTSNTVMRGGRLWSDAEGISSEGSVITNAVTNHNTLGIRVVAIPEPSSLLLLGLAGLLLMKRRRK